MTVRVPAKVNLHLAVGPRRPDGYHDVRTVFQAVSLYDELTVTRRGTEISGTTTGEGAADVPAGSDNLAVAAALSLAAVGGVDSGVHLDVRKGIPVAGGMAGGSADAAAALIGCESVWQLGLDRDALAAVAASLGSDVPFLLYGGTALGTGRGEQVLPVLSRGEYHWVFALAERGLPTSQVYAEHDAGAPMPEADPAGVLAALRAGDAVALGRALHNDLQAAALRLRPALRRTLDTGLEHGALGAVVSGSGPTCALLARDRNAAVGLAAGLAGAGVCRAVRIAHGPVGGARVVPATGRDAGQSRPS